MSAPLDAANARHAWSSGPRMAGAMADRTGRVISSAHAALARFRESILRAGVPVPAPQSGCDRPARRAETVGMGKLPGPGGEIGRLGPNRLASRPQARTAGRSMFAWALQSCKCGGLAFPREAARVFSPDGLGAGQLGVIAVTRHRSTTVICRPEVDTISMLSCTISISRCTAPLVRLAVLRFQREYHAFLDIDGMVGYQMREMTGWSYWASPRPWPHRLAAAWSSSS